jgi:hypothetical protein
MQTASQLLATAAAHAPQVGLGALLNVALAALYRSALIPRALAVVGFAAALLQLTAVTRPLFGHRILFAMLLPLGLTHLVLAGWLLAKGFEERKS